MNLRDVYGHILRELDRYQSPSFEVHEFNYFFPKAVDAVILDAFRLYRETKSVSDTIRFYTSGTLQGMDPQNKKGNRGTELLGNVRYVLTVQGNFLLEARHCRENTEKRVSFFLEEADELMLPSIMENSYLKPKVEEKRAYFQVEGRELKTLFLAEDGTDRPWNILSAKYTYVRDPDYTQFVLPANFLVATLPDLDVPVKILRKFIERTVMLFLENTTNPRLQTHSTINQ